MSQGAKLTKQKKAKPVSRLETQAVSVYENPGFIGDSLTPIEEHNGKMLLPKLYLSVEFNRSVGLTFRNQYSVWASPRRRCRNY
jgi:hypothetical protein